MARIVNLVSEIKAAKDSLSFIVASFNKGEISLEVMMKVFHDLPPHY